MYIYPDGDFTGTNAAGECIFFPGATSDLTIKVGPNEYNIGGTLSNYRTKDTYINPNNDKEAITEWDLPAAEGPEEFFATAYHCVYEAELDGTQTITRVISGTSYTLTASFLFGGHGVAMQGTGKTGPDGDYIHYDGGGGSFAHISNPEEFTDEVRQRYTELGITDFTGFGNLALTHPEQAAYSVVSEVTGASGRTLVPWYSIAVDTSVISLGTTGTLLFKSGTAPDGATKIKFRADDTGGGITGNHIDVYVGEGQAALDQWVQTGGNRYVEAYRIHVEQHIKLEGDHVTFTVKVRNNENSDQDISVRYLWDTQLCDNDGSPLKAKGTLYTKEMCFL